MLPPRTLRLALLFASFFCLSASRAQVADPDSMVRKLFATLPVNDEKSFVALYPSPQQLVELVKSILQSDEIKKRLAVSGQGQTVNADSIVQSGMAAMAKPETMAQLAKGFGENFQRTIEWGKKLNLDWSRARFVSYTADASGSDSKEEDSLLRKLGYKKMKGTIDFSVDTVVYRMPFHNVLFIPKEAGWYGGEFGNVVRKSEIPVPGKTGGAARTVAPPVSEPAPSPQTKTKTKTPGTKAKAKQ